MIHEPGYALHFDSGQKVDDCKQNKASLKEVEHQRINYFEPIHDCYQNEKERHEKHHPVEVLAVLVVVESVQIRVAFVFVDIQHCRRRLVKIIDHVCLYLLCRFLLLLLPLRRSVQIFVVHFSPYILIFHFKLIQV